MRNLFPLILVAMVVLSCAGSPVAIIQDNPPPQTDHGVFAVPVIDQVRELIKSDSKEIEKYFTTDENGIISVRADFRVGDAEFEILYDLRRPEGVLGPERFPEQQGDQEPENVLAFPPGEESLPVGFSIQDKRTGERREGSLQWSIREDEAGLLLGFDDDYRQAWEDSFEALEKYGARVTYFVQGGLSDFCFRAMARGHDIGYHTIHHLNLSRVSENEFYTETTSDIASFRQAGIPLRTFAYPFGFSEPWMLRALADTFAIQRGFGATFRMYTPEDIWKGYIVAQSIDNIMFKEDGAFATMIIGMFSTLRFIGGDRVLPITTHNISDTAQWGIKPRRLEYLLEAANFFKLKFYRYADFVDS